MRMLVLQNLDKIFLINCSAVGLYNPLPVHITVIRHTRIIDIDVHTAKTYLGKDLRETNEPTPTTPPNEPPKETDTTDDPP